MRTFVVTGGAGFIGSHIVEALVRRGDRVRVVDNLCTGFDKNVTQFGDKVELTVADVNDAAALAPLKAGDKVRFRAERINGVFYLTQVEKAP